MNRLGPSLARRACSILCLHRTTSASSIPSTRSRFHTFQNLRQHASSHESSAIPIPLPEPSEDTAPEESNKSTDDLPVAPEDNEPVPPKPKDKSNYGSNSKRAMRNNPSRQAKDPPRPKLPRWFLEGKVRLREELDSRSTLTTVPHRKDRENQRKLQSSEVASQTTEAADGNPKSAEEHGDLEASTPKFGTQSGNAQRYEINETIWEEVNSLVAAGLDIPSEGSKPGSRSTKPHILLQCPQIGSTEYLDGIVDLLAYENKADRIRIDGQDVEEASAEYLAEDEELRGRLRNLSYDAYRASLEPREAEEAEDREEDDEDSMEEVESHMPRSFSIPKIQNLKVIPKMIASIVVDGQAQPGFPNPFSNPHIQSAESEPDIKATLLVESFLEAGNAKRALLANDKESDRSNTVSNVDHIEDQSQTETPSGVADRRPTIIAIKEYLGMKSNPAGAQALAKLHEVVERRRNEGQRMLIVGTATGSSGLPLLSKGGVQNAQADQHNDPFRTIVIPYFAPATDDLFTKAKRLQVSNINMRNLLIMLTSICPDKDATKELPHRPADIHFKQSQLYASYLDEKLWPQHQIHRWATVAAGLANGQAITNIHLEKALSVLLGSDEVKFEWVEEERRRNKEQSKKSSQDRTSAMPVEERMDKLRKECNSHEKKLLSGVVDAGSIRTTFADVQAEASTIDTLRTLTTLSLVRPDAFTYGVLATERIPGMLLYGPPGTGKTLLAKAVAKGSGATVLEVDGSTVYDMYVGEGEKNVKAIFSLAKKLTPCIIFIDEADAILGTRTGAANRTSHRELINQFLREWDGMNETSAFIMVATNRPYDLDEACLRRLPRRVLVDLPTEKDREAILKIHLKDETLASEVSISKLAAQTPLYSGSDLKNLSVAAALRCVREEVETATNVTHKDRRILQQRHFDRALEEISASISEDMSSLSAIRKFDEKYGDRTGKRKKTGSYGFGTIKEGEKKLSDLARVRNQPA